ncbi:MAG TPA: hypothetical protein VHJ20_19845 [Polyangia bacterium]|nr:hypothetical protein [Polyangia bacterium]
MTIARGLGVIAALVFTTRAGMAHAQTDANAPAPPATTPAPAAPPEGTAPPPTNAPAETPPPPPPAQPMVPPPGYPYQPPPGYAYPPPYPYAYPAPAPYPPVATEPPPGYHTHDGFYLRLHLGPGGTNVSGNENGSNVEISGGGASLGVAIGGALTTNLILYGSFDVVDMSNPDVKVDGSSIGSSSADVSLDSFGIGMAYYVEPANVFIAGTLKGSKLEVNDSNGNVLGDTKTGVGFDALLGKEWWVSTDWGLGVAGQLVYASVKDRVPAGDPEPTLTTWGFNVLFTATYN